MLMMFLILKRQVVHAAVHERAAKISLDRNGNRDGAEPHPIGSTGPVRRPPCRGRKVEKQDANRGTRRPEPPVDHQNHVSVSQVEATCEPAQKGGGGGSDRAPDEQDLPTLLR